MNRARTSDPEFPRRVAVYENDEGLALLRELARKRSVSDSALIRMLIREEAKRVGVKYQKPTEGGSTE